MHCPECDEEIEPAVELPDYLALAIKQWLVFVSSLADEQLDEPAARLRLAARDAETEGLL